jgi:hypothetical protein
MREREKGGGVRSALGCPTRERAALRGRRHNIKPSTHVPKVAHQDVKLFLDDV